MARLKALLLTLVMVGSVVAVGGVAATPDDGSQSGPELPDWVEPMNTTTQKAAGPTLAVSPSGTSTPTVSDESVLEGTSATQPPAKAWSKEYDEGNQELFTTVEPTDDGGYIMSGLVYSAGDYDSYSPYVVKVDQDGNTEWSKTLPQSVLYGGDFTMGDRIIQTEDGGYALAVNQLQNDNEVYGTIIKLDSTGDIQWREQPAGDQQSLAVDLTLSDSGTIVVTGASQSGSSESDVWLAELDENSDRLLNEQIEEIETYAFGSALTTTDEGYAIAASLSTEDVWVGEVTTNGDVSERYVTSGDDALRPSDIDVTEDGGYIVSILEGYTSRAIKLDADLSAEWSQSYGGSEKYVFSYEVEQTDDGGFAHLGYFGMGDERTNYSTAIVRTNSRGDVQWTETYPTSRHDNGAFDGEYFGSESYILAGADGNQGNEAFDGSLVKVGSGGHDDNNGDSQTGIEVVTEPSSPIISPGSQVSEQVRVSNITDGIGAYELYINVSNGSVAQISDYTLNVKGADSTTDVSISDDNTSLHVETALADVDESDLTLVTPTLTGIDEGATDLNVNIKSLGSITGEPYNITSISGATVTVEDGVPVSIEPATQQAAVGGTSTVSVVAHDIPDGGVGAYDFTLSVANSNVATVEDVTFFGDPGQKEFSIGEDGKNVSVQAALANTADSGDIRLANVTLSTTQPGETALDLSVDALGSEAGTGYDVGAVRGATLNVSTTTPPPVVGDSRPTDPDGDGVYEDVNGDGSADLVDVQALFRQLESDAVQNNSAAFDFTGDGTVDVVDVQKFFNSVV